jgi:hypothetical protein
MHLLKIDPFSMQSSVPMSQTNSQLETYSIIDNNLKTNCFKVLKAISECFKLMNKICLSQMIIKKIANFILEILIMIKENDIP